VNPTYKLPQTSQFSGFHKSATGIFIRDASLCGTVVFFWTGQLLIGYLTLQNDAIKPSRDVRKYTQ
jgi:hypothetical protein